MPKIIDLSDFAATQTDGFIIQGDTGGDEAGTSVSAAGDVNGDGIDDVIVGAPSGDDGGTYAGEAYVVYGQSGGLGTIDLSALTAAQGFIIQGDTSGDYAGTSVSAAGDVNGDGIDDVIVGATYGSDGGTLAGEAYVVYGQSGGMGNIDRSTLTAAQGFIIQGDTEFDQAGRSVSAAGDVNGDGIDDVIVGAPYGDDGGRYAGEAYVVYGQSGGLGTIELSALTAAQGFIIQGDTGGDQAGFSVSAAGDVNGDGIDDVIVGARNGNDGGSRASEAYVVYGQSGGVGTIDLSALTASQGFIIQGDASGDQAGWSVSAAGDVNGDGIADVIVGAPFGDDGGSIAGEAYVVYGQSGGLGTIDLSALTAAQGFIIQGDTFNDAAGWSVSAAGDVNGDGIDDVIVGAPSGSDGGNAAGEAYVVYGQSGGLGTIDLSALTAAQGFIIQGDTGGDEAGRSVSAAGDVNGDGIDDVIVGAPYGDDGGILAGEAYVVYGFRTAPSAGADTLTGTDGDDTVIFTAATLTSGDSYDGGAGTDTVRLEGGGTYDFTGVTLTSVEAIETDGTNATIVLPDATYAPLITDLGGEDDTVVLGAAPNLSEIVSLLDAGAETVTFPDDGTTVTVTSSADDRIEMVYTDASELGDGKRYQTQTRLFERDGDLRQMRTDFDDGRSATAVYDEDGVITRSVITDGPGDTENYTSVTRTYQDGVRSQTTVVRDNSVTATTTYAADGETTTQVQLIDGPADTKNYTMVKSTYQDGVRSQTIVVRDNSVTATTTYAADGETTTQVELIDGPADAMTYETCTFTYNADGTLASRTIDYDDDDPNFTATEYEYDTSGVIESKTLYLTGGGVMEKKFVGGALVLRERTDADGDRTVFGFDGDQVITGGSGDDLLNGGAGNDRFVFADDTRSGGSFGTDFVRDFADGEDRLDLTDYGITSRESAEANAILREGNGNGNTLIDLGDDGAVTLKNFALANLTDDDFVGFT
ncbi:hypothetical protein RDV64_09275 [Acuticoccus sp. MNP-M23]|uniref:beta strand repeat-containing protein n=1 Tax=Acuticoccus sp. MNP-M23 TaxID=3072793 RepID=UPI0028160EBE|nr:hypothetical protein [Acuticoccus sp. MNP-M23]WMS44552.1 hypothetical protein RDV64_09275 [Acuticoccus sp. MNP-M23]